MKLAALLLLTLSLPALAVDELPQRDGRDPLDFEPSLRLYDVKPEPGAKTVPWETPLPDLDKARVAAERAKSKADRWEQLQRKGVLSKVEAEQARVQASRASLRYQQALVGALKARLASMNERAARGAVSPELLVTARADVANAERLLAEAEALAQRNDAEFARNQAERQRQLATAGLAPKQRRRK